MLVMRRFGIFAIAVVITTVVHASWYWPFDSDDDKPKPPRLSELMEPVSLAIDAASDLAATNAINAAVDKYREALMLLSNIENDPANEERARSPEFATVRTKRAYVESAIESLLLKQAQDNARPVAVSDTTELEKRLAEERKAKTDKAVKADEVKPAPVEKKAEVATSAPKKKSAAETPAKPLTRRQLASKYIAARDFNAADLVIREMLAETPNDLSALNLRAALEASQGDYKKAEATLSQAMTSHPRDYHSYYNMARVKLKGDFPDKVGAKRFYDSGRSLGGPINRAIEEAVK